jgi:hypothetical protein
LLGSSAWQEGTSYKFSKRSTKPVQKVKAQCDLALICQQMGDHDVAKTNFSQAVDASMSLPEPARMRELYRCVYHQALLYQLPGTDHALNGFMAEMLAAISDH